MKGFGTTLMVVGLVLLSGCADMSESQKRTATGSGVGAATGAVIGGLVGGGKAAAIGAGVGAAVGAGGGYLWNEHMEKQKREMEAATAGTGIAVSQTPGNELKLEIPSDLSFDTGKAEIKDELQPVLDRFADTLRSNPATNVRIVGHTDSTGSDAINDPLSLRRAQSVQGQLASRGIDRTRLAVDGVGSRQPVASNDTAEGRARNRRVEIFVTQAQAAAQP
ncbi:MAG TPA: OmpA family protein [Gammaproteobacteria bacterium]|nr:OmpA family protein [Gammaproteobacteria bacterium]